MVLVTGSLFFVEHDTVLGNVKTLTQQCEPTVPYFQILLLNLFHTLSSSISLSAGKEGQLRWNGDLGGWLGSRRPAVQRPGTWCESQLGENE